MIGATLQFTWIALFPTMCSAYKCPSLHPKVISNFFLPKISSEDEQVEPSVDETEQHSLDDEDEQDEEDEEDEQSELSVHVVVQDEVEDWHGVVQVEDEDEHAGVQDEEEHPVVVLDVLQVLDVLLEVLQVDVLLEEHGLHSGHWHAEDIGLHSQHWQLELAVQDVRIDWFLLQRFSILFK
jgi:hypothetical protein